MLGWMHWTWMSALGFILLGGLLAGLAVLDHYKPSYGRKGVLPVATTRGDRVFMSIAGFLALVFAWLKYFPSASPLVVVGISIVLAFVIIKWA